MDRYLCFTALAMALLSSGCTAEGIRVAERRNILKALLEGAIHDSITDWKAKEEMAEKALFALPLEKRAGVMADILLQVYTL